MISKKKDELIEISKTEAQRGKNYNDKKRNDSSRPVGLLVSPPSGLDIALLLLAGQVELLLGPLSGTHH